jgi:GAF domain-containing protein
MTTHVSQHYDFARPEAAYADLARDLRGLLAGERDLIANAANTAALIWEALPDLNWAGFYLYKSGELVLGPFQGKPACVRIALGKGVCGTAAAQRATVRVDDVHAFPGHIACDSASNSEIVVPLLHGQELLGVLDLDSPKHARFGATDQRGLEALAKIFVESLRELPSTTENAGPST